MSMIDKLKIAFLSRFGRMKVYSTPMFFVYNPHNYSIKGKHYYEARNVIKPGDVLIRGYTEYLDGYFIPGKYSHAAIYIGGDNEKIIHAMTPDVQYTDLCTFMRCDRIAIIRPGISEEDTKIAIDRAISKLGVPYDYDFVFEDEDSTERQFCCSELVYFAYQNNIKQTKWCISEKDYIVIRKSLFSPDDILPKEGSSATIIYEI